MVRNYSRIYIEISNICNLKCSFCPKTNRKQEFMDVDLFRRILVQIKDMCKEVSLHVLGEPLLHPQFSEIISACNSENVSVNLTTNGTLLGKDFEILISSSIKRISISLNSLSVNYFGEEYQKVLDDIFMNINRLLELRKDILITFRLIDEGEDTERLIGNISRRFSLKSKNLSRNCNIADRLFIEYRKMFSWPKSGHYESRTHGFCYGLRGQFAILADGTVVPCCLDYDGELALGNMRDSTIMEILQSHRACTMREGFSRMVLVEKLCQNCSYIRRFDHRMKMSQ